MKVAEVRKLELNQDSSLEKISSMLDGQKDRLVVDTINWKGFEYKPEVSVALAYGDKGIYIKYYVKENYIKAEKTESNEMVCEDSCVEFFVSPETDGIYYNIEFNAIGTCLLGSGTDRASSKRVDPAIISKIRRITSEGTKPFKEKTGEHIWTITIAIPFVVFFRHKIISLKGKTFMANFYKCGDKLSVPHYVTWNQVGTKEPDYHRPEYFGMLKFV
jgi:hypothetical protein